MAYLDMNGMVRQGDPNLPQQSYSPNSTSYGSIGNQSVNGASNWSPWPGQIPGTSQFDANNYKPKPGNTLSTSPVPMGPKAPTPLTPPSMGAGGGIGNQAGNQGGNLGTYKTGIEHGLLSNDAIAAARARLQPTAPMPTAANVPTNAAQQGQMAQQYSDLMQQGTQKQDMGLTRDAAYQQAQMALAQQKALAGAANAGFGNLVGLDAQNTQYDTSRQGMLLSMLKGMI